MSVRPQIPAVEGVQDKQVAGILGPMKMILEIITGRAPNRQKVAPLGANSGLPALTNKVNEVIARLQGDDVSMAPTAPAGTGVLTNSLGADVALNNTGLYFDGPSITVPSSGTWFVSGAVSVLAAAGDSILAKLWDGATVKDSTLTGTAANGAESISLSGVFTSPQGNIRISVKNSTGTTGNIKFNVTGDSKDSTLTAFRIA